MQNMQNEISFSRTTLEIAACSTCYSTTEKQIRSYVGMYVILYVGQDAIDWKGKKVLFLKSEKIGGKSEKK